MTRDEFNALFAPQRLVGSLSDKFFFLAEPHPLNDNRLTVLSVLAEEIDSFIEQWEQSPLDSSATMPRLIRKN